MSDFPIDNRTAAGAKTQATASKLPSHGGYGQNGFTGPSSDNPGKHTTSGFLPQVAVPKDDWQTRKVKPDPYPKSFGMTDRSVSNEKIPSKVHRG